MYSVVANMRGASAEEVAARLLASPELQGLQGPTIAPIYSPDALDGSTSPSFFAATVCVSQKRLYDSVKEIRKVCGPPCMLNACRPLHRCFAEAGVILMMLHPHMGILVMSS